MCVWGFAGGGLGFLCLFFGVCVVLALYTEHMHLEKMFLVLQAGCMCILAL